LEFLVSCPLEDVNGTVLVDKHLFYCVVFEFHSDYHGLMLLVVDAVEIVVSKGDGGHATSVVRVSYVIDGLEVTEVFLSGR